MPRRVRKEEEGDGGRYPWVSITHSHHSGSRVDLINKSTERPIEVSGPIPLYHYSRVRDGESGGGRKKNFDFFTPWSQ